MSGPVLLILRILLAACLYAFLGVALFVLWQDFKYQSGRLAQKLSPPISLIYQRNEEYVSYNFNIPELTIGRDPACDCVIEDSTVSAQHARLVFRQGQWWVEDLPLNKWNLPEFRDRPYPAGGHEQRSTALRAGCFYG